MVSNHHIFWYNPVFPEKDRTSFILMLLNRSLKQSLSDASESSTFYENGFKASDRSNSVVVVPVSV